MQFQDYLDDHENDKDFNFDLSEKKFIEQAFSIESSLFNCDLSDIPFEAWQDFYIISDENHVADFSKTRANIDFLEEFYTNNRPYMEEIDNSYKKILIKKRGLYLCL